MLVEMAVIMITVQHAVMKTLCSEELGFSILHLQKYEFMYEQPDSGPVPIPTWGNEMKLANTEVEQKITTDCLRISNPIPLTTLYKCLQLTDCKAYKDVLF